MTITKRTYAILQLMRPANWPTAIADILAGAAIAGLFQASEGVEVQFKALNGIVLASVMLYAAGVVLNDYYDLETDRSERPERPLPSGRVSLKTACILGYGLLIGGVLISFVVSLSSGFIALALAGLILLYDRHTKHFQILGPLTMGGCRSLNLLLGMSVLSAGIQPGFMLVPLVYIGAITLISQGEVFSNNKRELLLAGGMYFLVLMVLISLAILNGGSVYLWLILAVFSAAILTPLWKALKDNTPERVRQAVKWGVISLILLDTCLVALYGPWAYALLALMMFPFSLWLSRIFAVT